MADSTHTRRFRFWLWLIRLIGVIVPRRLRADWRREWEAELRHREELLTEWDRLDWRSKLDLLRRSASAFWDALWLQPKRLEDEMFQDLRYSARMLLKHKGFTAIAVLTLALGIGANTAMFSVLNTYLLRLLPYPDSDRIVRIYRTAPQSQSFPHSPANFFDFRDRNDVFDSMAAFVWDSVSLGEPGVLAERVRRVRVTVDYFRALGVRPALGRIFVKEEEESYSRSGVVILSHPYWMRRYGGDPGVLGRMIQLNGWNAEIVGVMPPGVEDPLLWGAVDMWAPQAFEEDRRNRIGHFLSGLGRLKPGVSLEQAQAAMSLLAANLAKEHPENSESGLRLEPLQRSRSDEVSRTAMWFTFGLAWFVLLIACANLANLQLVRASAQSRDYAVRAALGAGRGRLMRQSLTESVVVSMIGGALSLALAYWTVAFINRRLFSALPGAKVTIDFRVFVFALVVSVATGLIFGTVPAWLASRADITQTLRQNARGSTAGRPHHRLRHALIVSQIAFTLALLTGAGLFLRGLQRFNSADPGWRVDGLVIAQVALQGPQVVNQDARATFVRRLEQRLAVLPGVESAAISNSQPVTGFGSGWEIVIEGQPEPPAGQAPIMWLEGISSGYFKTLGVVMLAGREFASSETTSVAGKLDKIIINRTMARAFWPNESAVGKRIGPRIAGNVWVEVVGVVDDMRFPGALREPVTRFQGFYPIAVNPPWGSVTVALRTSEGVATVRERSRTAVAEIDPIQSVFDVSTAREVIDQQLGGVALLGVLLGAFAALGLTLAAIGIYGVTSYSVAQRTGEIGIRIALGAQRRDVLWLILRSGARLSVLGATLGVIGAYPLARFLAASIPTLPTQDPATFIALIITMLAVSLVACYLPARRAAKIEPQEALRYQ
jgi:predicted permease